MKKYGIFRIGTGINSYRVFELEDIINNLDKLNAKIIRILAGDMFIENRSKKNTAELKQDIINTLKSGKIGSNNLNDCIGSTPETKKITTINDLVASHTL